MDSVIRVESLVKSYRSGFWMKRVPVLKEVTFSVRPGKITGFIGSNGAGKTSTLRCVLGFTRPDQGQITFFDGEPLSSSVRARLGYLPEHPSFYDNASGLEFLRFHARLAGVASDHRSLFSALAEVDLADAAHKKMRHYSKGMLQRVGLAQAMIHRPDLLILDEPMSGLDPDGRRLVKALLKERARQGASVFFSSHLLEDVEDISQDVVVIVRGCVRYDGDLATVLKSQGETRSLDEVFAHLSRWGEK